MKSFGVLSGHVKTDDILRDKTGVNKILKGVGDQ